MGFNGYTELKHAFMKAVGEGGEVQSEKIENQDDMRTILKKVSRVIFRRLMILCRWQLITTIKPWTRC